MDMTAFSDLISNVGFPIVCVIILWKQAQDQNQNHKEEIGKLSESVHNNTLALKELTTIIKERMTKNEAD